MSTRLVRSLSKQVDPAAVMTSLVSGRGERLLHTYWEGELVQVLALNPGARLS